MQMRNGGGRSHPRTQVQTAGWIRLQDVTRFTTVFAVSTTASPTFFAPSTAELATLLATRWIRATGPPPPLVLRVRDLARGPPDRRVFFAVDLRRGDFFAERFAALFLAPDRLVVRFFAPVRLAELFLVAERFLVADRFLVAERFLVVERFFVALRLVALFFAPPLRAELAFLRAVFLRAPPFRALDFLFVAIPLLLGGNGY
jgi:hypothetical protein